MGPILIIDDSDTDRFLIKKALMKEQTALELIELEEGFEAVKTIKDKRPMATLLDIRMPGIDGFDVLKMIRLDPETSDHLVVMLSGSEEPSDIRLAREAGANGFLTKPATFGEYSGLAKAISKKVFGNREN